MMKNKNVQRTLLYIVYFVIAAFFLFPVLWVVGYSFKDVEEIFAVPLQIFPSELRFDNYLYVLENTEIVRSIWNSFYVVGISMVLGIILSLPVAYVFSRFRFKASRGLQFAILIFQMVSPIVVMVPLYNYFSQMGIINSPFVLILIYLASGIPQNMLNIKGYLDKVPAVIDEAAVIDGASKWAILFKIQVPIILPGIVSVSIIRMIALWGQFIVPFMLLSDSRFYPVSMLLGNLAGSAESVTTHYLSAACILGILPTTIIFVIFQRFIVSSMTSGAVKG